MILRRAPARPLKVLRIRSLAPERVREAARIEIGIDCKNNYNFGITGQSGTGKSSFINAVRGVTSNEPGAAEVGVEEKPFEIRAFPHPKYPYIVFWAIPRCRSKEWAGEDYFWWKQLFCLDSLIVMIGRNIKMTDLLITAQARKHEVPVFFVRSKSDKSINNIIHDRRV